MVKYGYKNIGFILDRGYFSKPNIQYMDENGFSFLLMVKGCKSLVSALMEQNRHSFESKRVCSIRPYRVYGTTVQSKLYAEDQQERYFHIYYSADKQASGREQVEMKIDRLGQVLQKNEGSDTKFGKTETDYFVLHYNKQGKLLYAEERSDVIQRELDLCGYFCLVSSAKIFIEFIALIVRNRIYNLLQEAMYSLAKKANYMTVPAALLELEKIEMVKRNKGYYRLEHAVTRRQKTILSAFGLDVEAVRLEAAKIGQGLLNKDNVTLQEEKQKYCCIREEQSKPTGNDDFS